MLNFAVVVDQDAVEAWQHRCVQGLLDSGHARLVAIVVNDMEPGATSSRQRQGKRLSDLPCQPAWVQLSAVADTAQEAEQFELDFLLCFPQQLVAHPALPGARLGCWSFRFAGPSDSYLAPGALEVSQGQAVSSVALEQSLGSGMEPRVLRSARQKTKLGVHKNSTTLLERAGKLPRLALLDVIEGRSPARHFAVPAPLEEGPIPSGAELLAASAARYARKLRDHYLFDDQWSILIYRRGEFASSADFCRDQAIAELAFPPWQGFCADPFLVETAERLYLLFEYYPAATRRGRIDVAVFSKEMRLVNYVQDLIPSPGHLSYPFMMPTPRGWLLVPEAGSTGQVGYHLLQAPDGPVIGSGTLLADFPGTDNTVHHWDGRYWMFNTHAADHETELLLWSADSPFGPWAPHPANPVKIDVQSSRPGGGLFVSAAGELIRPAQDGSDGYGGGLVFNRVLALGQNRFEEEVMLRIRPEDITPQATGVHHFSVSPNYVAVDYKVRKLRSRHLSFFLERHKKPTLRQAAEPLILLQERRL